MIRVWSFGLVLLALAAALPAAASASDHTALCKRFYKEVANGGKLEMIDELVSADFVEHEEFPGLPAGREGLRQFLALMRDAFPDLRFDVEFMLSDGDKVAAYLTMSGTHKGEFMGMPPSGKRFEVKTIDIIRFAEGKAVEHWGVTDAMTMMQQLGAMPPE